ncbi:hypothetical protein LSTR_LSTR000717 [Laodelphax striatellus]|uniref:Uncharacterized protein n=1 Tax=Laodelphax striatellus TaxID=195883 RepID=A0A482XFF1_LAOST|nr:hypothetical protein LSTR_LSTR000717 [Laodelphax striatellus]
MNISVIILMFRLWLLIILITSKSLAANKSEENWKCLNFTLAKLRGRREEPSLSKLKSLSDDEIVNYYSTILHKEPSAEKSYLSQIINHASTLIESAKSKVGVSSTERPRINSTVTIPTASSSLKTATDIVTKSILNNKQSDVELALLFSQRTTHNSQYTTNSNEMPTKLSNVSPITVYLGVFSDDLSKYTIPPLPSLNKKLFENIKRTTEYTSNHVKISMPSTTETSRIFTSSQDTTTSKNYAQIFLLMAHKFDEIEHNLQTFKKNQLFLAHKVKNISDKLEFKDGEPSQIIRPDINKILAQLVNVGTAIPASSNEALSNLTNF